ncbi:MAG: hypothetical protein NTU63_01935 [Candidatus Pacearchaeota archaeon]|nr:hypothetical protein [Candidatus Pacearchaeota archaeon]
MVKIDKKKPFLRSFLIVFLIVLILIPATQANSSSPINGGGSSNASVSQKCGQLIYFCSENAPCCAGETASSHPSYNAINEFEQNSGCIEVVRHINSDFADLENDDLAKQYRVFGVPTFIFIDENNCTSRIGNGCSTELTDLEKGIANSNCINNPSPDSEINNPPQNLCSGCHVNDSCLSLGFRKEGKYCSENKLMIIQKQSEESCDNSFECESNVCASEKCVSADLITRILNWFKHLFEQDNTSSK